MINKHTPGPWQSDGLGRIVAVGEHKGMHGAWQRDICSLRDRVNDLGTAAADTALIAAAPDLLAALRDILALVNMTPAGHERETLELIADRVAAEGIES